MPVGVSAVEIAIHVTDVNSGAVVAGVTQNLKQLGTAGAGVRAQLTGTAQSFTQFGVSGTIAGRIVKQSMEETGNAVALARERAHLFTEEFGIHLPRAFRGIIAESKMAQTVLAGLGSTLVGIGAIQIGAIFFDALVSGAEKAWHFMTDLSKGTQEYLDQVQKAKEEDFGNTRSIEDTRLRIEQATDAVKDFNDQAAEARKASFSNSFGWRSAVPMVGQVWQWEHQREAGNDASDQVAKAQAQLDKLEHLQEAAQAHEQRSGDIDLFAASRAQEIQKLPESSKAERDLRANAERDLQVEEATRRAHEERFYTTEQDKALGNPVDPNSGRDKEARAVTLAQIKANTELAEAQSKTDGEAEERARELQRIHEEALESGLRGNALYHAQEAAAIDDLKSRHIATAQAIRDVEAKFHNEAMKRYQDEDSQIRKMREQTDLAGKTGVAKVQQEGQNKLNDIFNDTDSKMDPGQRLAAINEINKQTHAEMLSTEQEFTQRVKQLADDSATHQISGFARIRAEAQKQIDGLVNEYQKLYGTNVNAPEYKAHLGELNKGEGSINQGANQQTTDLARRNADETAQIEEAARVRSLSAERQKSASIEAEYESRLQKYRDELQQQEISQDDFNRRVAAAAEERDADMVAAARDARQKMAGEFSGLFKSLDHPMQALASLGDKVAGEAAASLVQRLQQRSQGGAGAGRSSTPGGDIFTEILGGNVFGGRKSTNITNSTNVTDIASGAPHTRGTVATASGRMQIASAQIEIASASFVGGGSTSSGGSVPGIAGGSTGLLGPNWGLPRTGTSPVPGFKSQESSTRGPDLAYDAGPLAGKSVPGLLQRGNIDVNHRPSIKNADGSESSIYSMTVPVGAKGAPVPWDDPKTTGYALVPSIANGKFLSPDGKMPTTDKGNQQLEDAATAYYAKTRQQLGIFKTSQAADQYAGATHSYGNDGTSRQVFMPSMAGSVTSAPAGTAMGGAGDPTGTRAATNFAAGSGAAPPQKPDFITSAIGDVQKGLGFAKQGAGLVKGFMGGSKGGGSSSSDQDQYAETQDPVVGGSFSSDGSFSSSSDSGSGGSMLQGGGIGANAAGAIGGGLGLFSAYEGGGGVGGAASGAMSGMQFGMAVGGPIGAAIGAVGGAVLGAIGFGGREKARVYDLKTVRPALKNDQDSYDQGSMDYLTAFSAMQTLQNQAFAAISPMGPAARAYRNDTIDPEIKQAEAKLSAAERAGRSNYTAQAAQYDIGTDSVPHDGFAMIHEKERIMPSDQNERITRALENGSTMPVQNWGFGGDVHLHVHTMDTQGVKQFLDSNKHHIRSAVNDSLAENSGGGLA